MKKRWFYINLPITPYEEAWDLQCRLVAARKTGALDTNVILLLEHLPVFTLGRRGGLENLAVSETFLEKEGIAIVQVERGGNITFHGPGQIVVYPIIDLQSAGLRVVDYVYKLEEVMIRTAQDWGIVAERNSLNRGVWVGNSKLGSVGIAIRRGICFHGAAFNVNVSLKPFEWMKPCGLQDVTVTSLEQQSSGRLSMKYVRESLKAHLSAVFEIDLVESRNVSVNSHAGMLGRLNAQRVTRNPQRFFEERSSIQYLFDPTPTQ
jgi:lipoate-protein ligase B